MNSNYKLREQLSTRLRGPNANNFRGHEESTSTKTFTRTHQRNLSLPINSVFKPTASPNNESTSLTATPYLHDNDYCNPVQRNYQDTNNSDNDSSNSDTGSTGTYIIEKSVSYDDNKSDALHNFENATDEFKKSNSMVKKLRSSWVNEWHSKLSQNQTCSSTAALTKTDIKPPPSPKLKRYTRKSNIPLLNSSSIKDLSENSIKNTSSDDDTRSILKDAENCVNMMEAKVDKAGGHTSIQYNRTFNLRRDRFSKASDDFTKKNDIKAVNGKSGLTKPSTQTLSSSMSRVDCGRYSLRTSRVPQPNSSPLLSARKNLSAKKKWNSSILCNKVQPPNKETELENWKRRKNYDPMKAAAEGKKKELQKQTNSFSKGKCATTSSNPVLRSASFHGRDNFCQDDDDDDSEQWDQNSLNYYEPVDNWHKLPHPPATSRDHSPQPLKSNHIHSSATSSSLASLPTRMVTTHNGLPTPMHKSLTAFNSSTSSSLDVSSMREALFDTKDTSNMVQLSYKTKKRGIELLKRIKNELPEYDYVELTRGIEEFDLNDDAYHVPMESWEMSVAATNVNCVNNIFGLLEMVLFNGTESGDT
ncbi:dentin sialophosphoprotein [Adelges cooleyi]|uniref:dentin sialophosphoprotein n=1 Tax=Adelges cooleyi TaxID=133065 RepID=UPI00217FFD24|nr:dentin sialophosphoprotein [Adelges cooleyi]